ncbi:MAG TPA: VTT domain-containing protein [Kofleriaceae bacterium]|nr:VTT domain-containing protein [Kofleriaceae bacterium]
MKIALLVVAGAAIVAAVLWLPAGEWIRAAVTWVRGTGVLGIVVFSLVFIALAVTILPTMEMYLAAGMLYGAIWGALLMNSLGLVVELCTLLIVKTSLRKRIEPMIERHPKLQALDTAIRKNSLSILFLLRLSPLMPFGVLNYALAMTKVPLWKRLVTNFVGMLPCTLMLTYVGSYLSSVTQLSNAQPPSVWKHVALWGGLATTIAATWLAARATRHALHEQHPEAC